MNTPAYTTFVLVEAIHLDKVNGHLNLLNNTKHLHGETDDHDEQ